MKIGAVHLTILRFADDIILLGKREDELQMMMHDWNWNKVGLKVNITKTKGMANRPTTIKVEDDLLENVHSYTYFGNLVTIEGNHGKKISRRLGIAWSNFEKLEKYLRLQ